MTTNNRIISAAIAIIIGLVLIALVFLTYIILTHISQLYLLVDVNYSVVAMESCII